MTETESLIAEVRQLRADVARLHAARTAVHIRHGWMGLLFKDLSTNPYTQYKVHMWGAIYWLINFPLSRPTSALTPQRALPRPGRPHPALHSSATMLLVPLRVPLSWRSRPTALVSFCGNAPPSESLPQPQRHGPEQARLTLAGIRP